MARSDEHCTLTAEGRSAAYRLCFHLRGCKCIPQLHAEYTYNLSPLQTRLQAVIVDETMMRSYRISGLNVGSTIELPGAINISNENTPMSGGYDVLIRHGNVPGKLDGATASEATWQIAEDRFLLTIPNVASFLLTSGREITFEAEPGGIESDIPIFLLGTVFGILLHQRGRIVLHASAVNVNGRAVLFCGSSGAGKSTMAAALNNAGLPLVSDDVCSISFSADDKPQVHPDGRSLKLWQQAIDRIGLDDRKGMAVRHNLQKYYIMPDVSTEEPLPMGAAYILEELRPPAKPGIEKLNFVEGAMSLRHNAYRPQLVRRMGQQVNYFQATAALTACVDIHTLTRSFYFSGMEEVIGWLTAHWREIGLTEGR